MKLVLRYTKFATRMERKFFWLVFHITCQRLMYALFSPQTHHQMQDDESQLGDQGTNMRMFFPTVQNKYYHLLTIKPAHCASFIYLTLRNGWGWAAHIFRIGNYISISPWLLWRSLHNTAKIWFLNTNVNIWVRYVLHTFLAPKVSDSERNFLASLSCCAHRARALSLLHTC